jgi:hypothetical protein
MDMARLCMFCSEVVEERSREHIVPQWLWPFVGLTKGSMLGSVHKGRTGPLPSESFVIENLPEKPMGNFVEGRVCTECNTGWMSKLEVAVKPLLTPILDTPTLVDEWPITDRELLARWAVKTSLMAISRSVVSQNAPADHFKAIKEGRIPEGIGVFAGYSFFTDKGFSYEAGRNWEVEMPPFTANEVQDEILGVLKRHSYKVCLQFSFLTSYDYLSANTTIGSFCRYHHTSTDLVGTTGTVAGESSWSQGS